MEQEERKHQRRVRYRGTHPKRYEEKYKELQPEKYPETVAKVIQKGSTPVGMHIPIMVNEILDFLQIQPGQTFKPLRCRLPFKRVQTQIQGPFFLKRKTSGRIINLHG